MTRCARAYCRGSLVYDADRRQQICSLCGRVPGLAEPMRHGQSVAPRVDPAALALERLLQPSWNNG